MCLNFIQELRFIKMKNDVEFEDELTCCFKIDVGNLINFDPST